MWSGSIHTLVAQGNFLQNAAEEKKNVVEELEDAEKIRKKKRDLQYFTKKESCFFDFVAFAKFVRSIVLVITLDLLHEMLWFSFDFIGIKSMFFQSVLGKSWGNIWIFLVGTLYYFFSKFIGRILDGLRMSFKKFLEQVNSCLWIFFFIIASVQCRNFQKYYFSTSYPLYIHVFKTSSFISSKRLLINNLFALLKTLFVLHNGYEKW